MKTLMPVLLVVSLFALMTATGVHAADPRTVWPPLAHDSLKVMGHRNWIVIADSAYPEQSAPAIKTIYTGEDHFEVLEQVLAAADAAPHVSPVVYLDQELDHVPEADARGINSCRAKLKEILKGREIKAMPHETIIAKLDETSQLYTVLILKTDLALPYTSVFLELDCQYWDSAKENRMREAMAKKASGKAGDAPQE